MGSCLVQQLFRNKICKELPPEVVDEVLFPMLRSRKEYPKELLLDIKLTRSLCTSRNAIDANYNPLPGDPPLPFVTKILPFEKELFQRSAIQERAEKPPGKVSSKLRRRRHMSAWGTIDILNELRERKHPQIDYFPSSNPQWDSEDHFEDAYILLKETQSKEQLTDDSDFVNEFLEDALTTGKRLSWGGDPEINSHERILSTHW